MPAFLSVAAWRRKQTLLINSRKKKLTIVITNMQISEYYDFSSYISSWRGLGGVANSV